MISSIHGTDVFDWHTLGKHQAFEPLDISQSWKSVDTFAPFSLKSGTRILFWHHLWLGSEVLKDKFSRLFRLSTLPNGAVSDFWDAIVLLGR